MNSKYSTSFSAYPGTSLLKYGPGERAFVLLPCEVAAEILTAINPPPRTTAQKADEAARICTEISDELTALLGLPTVYLAIPREQWPHRIRISVAGEQISGCDSDFAALVAKIKADIARMPDRIAERKKDLRAKLAALDAVTP